MRTGIYASAAATAILLAAGAAWPQQSGQSPAQNKAAQGCLKELGSLAQKMEQDGYWLTGWGRRWGYGVTPATRMTGTPAPAGGAATTAPGGTAPPADPAATNRAPWGNDPEGGVMAPRYQIRILYGAANVLGQRGDRQGCNAVLAALKETYSGYIERLQQAGVDPQEVTTWRQQRILAAKPVEQLQAGAINVADITGTEIRNVKDEQLASIDDVVLDPQSGAVEYVIANVGGFFGIGDEHVAIPWTALKATPGLNTFVLDVSEQTMEAAPKIEPDRFVNAGPDQAQRQKIDQFWQKQIKG